MTLATSWLFSESVSRPQATTQPSPQNPTWYPRKFAIGALASTGSAVSGQNLLSVRRTGAETVAERLVA